MMTYKKFVEHSVDLSATEWIEQLAGDDWIVYSGEVRLERGNDAILYDVDFKLVKKDQPWIRKSYTVGGAIGEYTGICNSVIWHSAPDKHGIRAIAWAHNKELRDLEGITAESFNP